MILVTGASGKTGRAVVAALARGGAPTRAMVRHPSQIEALSNLGALEVIPADMRLAPELRGAVENVRAIYHICPNVSPDEVEIGRRVIAAAEQAGVEHLVLHSVLHPQAEQMPHHWSKLRVEEMLFESGLSFTVLQPAAYMQNLLAGWKLIAEEGVLRNPYPVQTRLSLVDLEDVAQAAALVLTTGGHTAATYELAGTPPLTQTEVAAILSEALGRPVRAEAEPIEAWEPRARAAGLSDHQRATLIKMFHYYERHGLMGNPNTLRWLLGRQPTALAQFARRAAGG
ncbi:MAG TPA: NmrA family NAD(P)-binding protein [Anaerolineales bacterium]|nr:NmrA family NAD(P)-binding protein [Anaerolineales bacterium]